MDSHINFYRPLPLLPVGNLICPPGRSLTCKLPTQPYFKELVSYVERHTANHLAIAYLKEGEGEEASGELYPVTTVVSLDRAQPLDKNANSPYWEWQVSNGVRARLLYELPNPSTPFRLARLMPYDEEEQRLSLTQTFFLILPIWAQFRRLSAGIDCYESTVPSCGNRYFSGYMQNVSKFLEDVYRHLPLSYAQKIDYLAAHTVADKGRFLIRALAEMADSKYYFKTERADYARLCRINSNAFTKSN